jgi:hypothetical protein
MDTRPTNGALGREYSSRGPDLEHITFDLIEQAKSSGVHLSSVDRGLGDEPPHQVGDNVH